MNEYVDVTGQTTVRLEPQRLALLHPALALQFIGDWAIASDSDARVFGHLQWHGRSGPATLQLAANAAGLTITLRCAQGQIVLGPVPLRRRADGRAATPGAERIAA